MISLDLPWPPTTNTMYAVVRGRKILSKKGRIYKADVLQIVLQRGVNHSLSGRIKLYIDAFPPDKRRRDISNIIKAIEDALTNAGVWLDDSQIDELIVTRCEREKGGRVHIQVTQIEN